MEKIFELAFYGEFQQQCAQWAEILQHQIHMEVYKNAKENTGKLFFSSVYNCLIDTWNQLGYSVEIISHIMNYRLYQWNYGNCITDIIDFVFNPMFRISKAQMHDAYRTLYRLIHFYKVDVKAATIYSNHYFEYIQNAKKLLASDAPKYLYDGIEYFSVLLKYGSSLIIIQETYMKRFLRKCRRKKAAKLISDWWFEIINSPYTCIGERMLKKRALDFKKNSS